MPEFTPLSPDAASLDVDGEPRRTQVPAQTSERDEIHRLEEEIATKRQRVIASLGELRRRVNGATDWRHWVESHPVLWICAGLSLGFLLGYSGRQNNKRRR